MAAVKLMSTRATATRIDSSEIASRVEGKSLLLGTSSFDQCVYDEIPCSLVMAFGVRREMEKENR